MTGTASADVALAAVDTLLVLASFCLDPQATIGPLALIAEDIVPALSS